MKSIKKIAFIATVYRHLEAFHLPYIKILQEMGYELHVYGSFDRGKTSLLNMNVICHDVDFSRNPFSFNNVKALRNLINSFRKNKYSMIHVHTPIASFLVRIAAKVTNTQNVIYTAHGFHFFKSAPIINWILYYPLERFMAKFTRILITINKEDYCRARNFISDNRVRYVKGVGVDTSYYSLAHNNSTKLRKQLGLRKNDFVIICIAELNNNKNHIQLINAIKIVKQKHNNIKCLLVGYGENEQELKYIVQKENLHEEIKFLGFRTDISSLLKVSNIKVLLSKREGLPKSIIEAMASSKPILATNIRGNRDLVSNGINGYLVPVGADEITAKKICTLLEDNNKINVMGQKSKEKANEYDLNSIKQDMKEIYKEVLK
ncbi:hypothetical protein ABE41_018260 [Fictibacillus arsenicus]|uniref:Glycosyltransferase family 1 protein n=1 Tax=Fictibacillus arsenicus TaxID=255247 RepID=A0A1B1Z941_9BACL|nr:glycosyltransferase family 4 protein [Fictibacillus arsenicus]ANX13960.1 hypothetical protein ABE41_018260 [Fictibacillus arsenicus]